MATKDDVRIEIATPSHRPGLLELAEIFVKNEPVRVALDVTWEHSRAAMEKTIDSCLQHSHVAVNDSGKIVGFSLCKIIDLSQYEPEDSLNGAVSWEFLRNLEDPMSKDWAKILVDEKGERCKRLLRFTPLVVHPDYAGRGLATRLCEANIKLGKKMGCDCTFVFANNFFTQKIFRKLGFTTASSVLYEDLKDSNGRPLIQMKDPMQKAFVWYVKMI